jgi:23S rRNA (guanosine2251-2'-O)-methyltransferase
MEAETVMGRNAVLELLRSEREVHKIYLKSEGKGGAGGDILHLAKERGVPCQFVDAAFLTRLCGSDKHRGVAAVLAVWTYVEPEDILAAARLRGEEPLLAVLDEIQDPQNLGAILRSAEALGVHGVIIPKRRGAGLTAAVMRASAGAAAHLPVARVPNIVRILTFLQENGCFVTGADIAGKSVLEADLTGPRVIVIGGEDKGLGRLVKETCDELVTLPMSGRTGSLNAACAAAVFFYECLRQRREQKEKR